jgi:DNA-directed RNA polymerase subunit RPC12/RpoP
MAEDNNMICHYCRCDSEYLYVCSDCEEDFCLTCVPAEGKTIRQIIRCPRCSGRNVIRKPPVS